MTKVRGTLKYLDIEGGIWRLEGDDGETYDLLSDVGFARGLNGKTVEVEGEQPPDIVGIGMGGGPTLNVTRVTQR